MRCFLLLAVVAFSGCKTAEIAFIYPATGMQLVARLQAPDERSATAEAVTLAAHHVARVNPAIDPPWVESSVAPAPFPHPRGRGVLRLPRHHEGASPAETENVKASE